MRAALWRMSRWSASACSRAVPDRPRPRLEAKVGRDRAGVRDARWRHHRRGRGAVEFPNAGHAGRNNALDGHRRRTHHRAGVVGLGAVIGNEPCSAGIAQHQRGAGHRRAGRIQRHRPRIPRRLKVEPKGKEAVVRKLIIGGDVPVVLDQRHAIGHAPQKLAGCLPTVP